MTHLVYFSLTGVSKRLAKPLGGVPLDEYTGGAFVVVVPTYGSPRTGGYVPKPVKAFLAEHGALCAGVVGVGNRNFGPDFCKGAHLVAERFNVPLITAVDVVPYQDDIDKIRGFLD